MRVILDWHEKSHLAKVRLATAVDAEDAWFEVPYGAISRPATGDEEPGQRWIDHSGRISGIDGTFGLAVLNDSKYGFDVRDGEIGITAVRSPIYAHHEPMTPKPGVRYQFQDLGVQRFTLSLLPHRGTWADAGLTRAASELNQRPTVLLESAHSGRLPDTASYAAVEPDGLVLGAVKLSEDGDDVVVRLVETCGRAVRGAVDLPLWQRRFEVDVGPFEIRTFRVSRDPEVEPEETDLLERPLSAARESSESSAAVSRMTARSGGT